MPPRPPRQASPGLESNPGATALPFRNDSTDLKLWLPWCLLNTICKFNSCPRGAILFVFVAEVFENIGIRPKIFAELDGKRFSIHFRIVESHFHVHVSAEYPSHDSCSNSWGKRAAVSIDVTMRAVGFVHDGRQESHVV